MISLISVLQNDPQDDYEILKVLGKGSSGEVYHARNKTNSQEVALKKIVSLRQTDIQIIRNEIALTLTSQHRNIVKYYQTYEHAGGIYMVVELMDGSLYDLIKHGSLSLIHI